MCLICQAKEPFRQNHYAYHLHSANPPIDADPEETTNETPFPPLFHVLCLVFHSMPQSACCRKSYNRPHRFFKPASLRSPIFFKVTPDWNDSRTRRMMKRKQTTQRTPKHAFRHCQILLQLRQLLQRVGGISWSWTPRYKYVKCEMQPDAARPTPSDEP